MLGMGEGADWRQAHALQMNNWKIRGSHDRDVGHFTLKQWELLKDLK